MVLNVVKPWKHLNWPNRISLIRLLLVAPFVILLVNQHHWPHARYAALAIFAGMALSDALDGVLARRLNARTRLGAILDPLADKVLIICSAVLLSLPESSPDGLMLSNWIVVFIVGKDLWVILGFLVIYLVTDRFLIHPAKAGKACTVGQVIMVLCFLAGPDLNRLASGLGSRVALALSWVVAGLCVLAVISYTRMGLVFILQEEKPLEDTGRKPASRTMEPIEDILDELRGGRMIVLVDDETRENEGDLVCAAEHVTPQDRQLHAQGGPRRHLRADDRRAGRPPGAVPPGERQHRPARHGLHRHGRRGRGRHHRRLRGRPGQDHRGALPRRQPPRPTSCAPAT